MSDTPSPSQQWLERWQRDGDAEALDSLLRHEIAALARLLRARAGGMIGASVSASDLAQEAVLRMLRLEEPPEFTSERELRSYLWKAAWRLLVNRLEQRRKDSTPVDELSRFGSQEIEASGGLSTVDRADQAAAIGVLLNLLEASDREILESIYFRHEPIQDAAARLGVTRSALDMRLTRARQRLAEKMMSWSKAIG